jgi:hypothetical protein
MIHDADTMNEEEWQDYVDRQMDREFYGDDLSFADPGGESALRAATSSNPRNQTCPDCDTKNVLTVEDRRLGYCCNRCAERKERGFDY